jgi:hypothetical protein
MKTTRSIARPCVSARTTAAAPRECAITACGLPSCPASARSVSAKCTIELRRPSEAPWPGASKATARNP